MQKRNVGRPRGGDPVETRRGILNAAEECFAASGFVGATTRQVAARAGVNVATLHYHFGSKEKLYRAVLDAATREDIPFPGSGATPEERLSSAVEALWDFGAAHPALPRLSLLHRLAGPASSAGALETPEDPRAALLLADARGDGHEDSAPAGRDGPRHPRAPRQRARGRARRARSRGGVAVGPGRRVARGGRRGGPARGRPRLARRVLHALGERVPPTPLARMQLPHGPLQARGPGAARAR